MNKLLSILRFLLILAGCFACAFIVVWPLWKFATSNGKAYTITVLAAAAVLLILAIVRKIRQKIKDKHEKSE